MPDLTTLLKAFTDGRRIKLLAQICDEALPLHTLALRAGLSEGEAMAQVALLKEAGLLEETFAADGFRWQYKPKALFELLAAERQAAKPSDLPEGFSAAEAKVLGDFLVNGRLKTIPAQRKKLDVVLRYLAAQFDVEKTYTEQEVSFQLLNYHEDYATLRRALVDGGWMRRENGIYRRVVKR